MLDYWHCNLSVAFLFHHSTYLLWILWKNNYTVWGHHLAVSSCPALTGFTYVFVSSDCLWNIFLWCMNFFFFLLCRDAFKCIWIYLHPGFHFLICTLHMLQVKPSRHHCSLLYFLLIFLASLGQDLPLPDKVIFRFNLGDAFLIPFSCSVFVWGWATTACFSIGLTFLQSVSSPMVCWP